MNKMDLHSIRQDYSRQSLKEDDCHDLPLEQFQLWLSAAIHAEVNEPTAMNVATVDEDGRPNARIVLLKEVTEKGVVFFTNYLSRKGRALSKHPYAALTLFWPELERQVRIEGMVKLLSTAESDAYFYSRPYSSRIGAWASQQSEVIRSKAELMGRVARFSAKYLLNVPRPPYWGGYVVIPERIEFWQGRPSRLHDRIEYRLEDSVWHKQRLSP